jgi:hypothetical protein
LTQENMKLRWTIHGQRPQEQRIDQPEGGQAGADCKRQRKHGGGGGHPLFRQVPPSKHDVGTNRVEPGHEPHVAAVLAVSKRRAERASCVHGIAPVRDRLLDVRVELFIDLVDHAFAAKHIDGARPPGHVRPSSGRD